MNYCKQGLTEADSSVQPGELFVSDCQAEGAASYLLATLVG